VFLTAGHCTYYFSQVTEVVYLSFDYVDADWPYTQDFGVVLLDQPVYFLQNVPSEPHGSACGGDSGSPVFLGDTNQLVAVHTGGYRLGPGGVICGRLTSLNHRLDSAVALAWINSFL
jgi:hypothetical protein